MKRGAGSGRHSDDELAGALEEEVARTTAAIPIVGRAEEGEEQAEGDGDVAAAASAAAGSLSDAEVTAMVDADLHSHDTFAALRHLQSVLDARASSSQQIAADGRAEAPEEDEGEDGPAEREQPGAGRSGPPTELISFDDLPGPRAPSGPEPTFSAWVGAAVLSSRAVPVETGADVARVDEAGAEENAAPVAAGADEPDMEDDDPAVAPPAADDAAISSARAEPLGRVSEELAPRDSQPVPLLPNVSVIPVTGPVVTHDMGGFNGVPGPIDDDVADDADDADVDAPEPRAAPRLPDGETVLLAAEPVRPPVLVPEPADLEPTPTDQRVGRAARMFWLWFAGTSSLISVGVGATLFRLGLSLRQLLVATVIGVAVSFLPLGLGTLAGTWSGQPTMVVSRATFGMRGNALPAAIALLTKLFWGAVLLWLAGWSAGSLATAEGWTSDAAPPTVLALAATILVSGVVAFFGYGLVARVQLVLTIASAVLILLMIAVTWRHVDLSRALAVPDALWTHVVGGAVLVFSYLGLAWAMSSAEVARYQHPSSSGAVAMLWATFGAAVPPFVLVSYGGLLAAGNPAIAAQLASDPVRALAGFGLPSWYAVLLLLTVGLSLTSALVLTTYSGGFTLEALGVRLGRRRSTIVVAGAIGIAGAALAVTVSDLGAVIGGVPIALAVPVAAWAGIFAGETMLRTRRFHSPSLLARGGVYPDWRWPNLAALVLATAVGLGLVGSPLPLLAWEGYLFRLAGVDQAGFGASNIGVVVALVIGILTPIVSGVPAVRRQEQATV